MSFLEAILLGLAQGVTEFLPVSSSGHLVLLMDWLQIEEIGFLFNVIVHGASALAILVFFFKLLGELARQLWLAIIIGSVPAAVLGFLVHRQMETLFSEPRLVGLALLVTAAFNLIIYWKLKSRGSSDEVVEAEVESLSWQQGLKIGLFQALAIIPGISRSGSTVMAGLVSGLSRQMAFRFSFMLALPAIGGAVLVELLALNGGSSLVMNDVNWLVFGVGALSAFLASLASLYLLRWMMIKAQFQWFALYALVVALAVIFF